MKIEGSAAADILAALQRVMASAPPPWLASQPRSLAQGKWTISERPR